MKWQTAPEALYLPDGEIHVWRVSLQCSPEETARYRALLAPEEAGRASRFRFENDRTAFIVRRGILRMLLGRYSHTGPFAPSYSVTPYGQLLLPAESGCGDLRFSVSRSGDAALLAFAVGMDIGVDLEAIRPNVDYSGVARRFFSQREQEALRILPAEQQREGFFACWSRKEAYIKARGKGLSIPLDQFDVSLAPGEPAQLLATRDDSDHAPVWSMQSLDPGPEYAAALAAAGPIRQVHCWEWEHP